MIESGFGIADYVVFGVVLLFCTLIGVIYAFSETQSHVSFLLGDRKMSVTPVAISIIVTFMSAITIIGCPAEIYTHGAQFWVSVLSTFVIIPIVIVVFLPIFYRSGLTSVYEYIEMRFKSRLLRAMCVFTCLLQTSLYMGLAFYAPCLALSATTTISVSNCILGLACVATCYTVLKDSGTYSLMYIWVGAMLLFPKCLPGQPLFLFIGGTATGRGGIKAVIWADVLQSFIMVAGMIAIIVQASVDLGGFSAIFSISSEHGRMDLFDFTFDPWQRHNFWNLYFGFMFFWVSFLGVNQSAVQRYNSLPTLRHAKLACLINGPFLLFFVTLVCMCGLAIFATYAHCDPLKQGLIDRKDKIVPFYVLDRLSHLPGLAGLFIACITSGALSTVSSGLNSMAAITWKDFLVNLDMFRLMKTRSQATVLRIISCCYGGIATGLALLMSRLGGLLQLAIGINGAFTGPLLGVFSLGILVPFSNSKGAILGLVLSELFNIWVVSGSNTEPEPLPTDISHCPGNSTMIADYITPLPSESNSADSLNWVDKYVHGVSYRLYNLVGCSLCFTIGLITSALTGGRKLPVDEDLMFRPFKGTSSCSRPPSPVQKSGLSVLQKPVCVTERSVHSDQDQNKDLAHSPL